MSFTVYADNSCSKTSSAVPSRPVMIVLFIGRVRGVFIVVRTYFNFISIDDATREGKLFPKASPFCIDFQSVKVFTRNPLKSFTRIVCAFLRGRGFTIFLGSNVDTDFSLAILILLNK